jgi:hypothetical protein
MLPEEQELQRLELEQNNLSEEIANDELQLENTKTDISRFKHRYYQTVGRLYAELDDLDARLARIEAGLLPEDDEAKKIAEDAEAQAKKSAEEAGIIEAEPTPPPPASPELKKLFKKAAMLMHPDRATNEAEKLRRNDMMAKLNVAYEQGDEASIEKLLVEFGHDPEAIQGDDVGARMIKVIRRIAQLRRRASEIILEREATQAGELFELMQTVIKAENLGGNPLSDLASQILAQISERKISLELMNA